MSDEQSGGEARVEELLRVNTELAAEVRRLALDRNAAPRSAPGPAARRVGRLIAERDSLLAELDQARSQLDVLVLSDQALREQIHEQHLHIEQLGAEVHSLRGGLGGGLRRLRARFLRRPRG